MPKTDTVDKFFNAVNEAYDAMLDAAKSPTTAAIASRDS